MHKPFVTVSAWFYLWLAVAIVLLPIKWLIAWIIAILCHEMFHYIALRVFQYHVFQIHIGIHGVKMITEEPKGKRGVYCALAGPLAGFVLFAFVQWTPRIAICALLQSLYNLLPFFPLDGGRALRCILQSVVKNRSVIKVQRGIEATVLLTIVLFLIIIFLRVGLKILPLIVFVCLSASRPVVKFPCKALQKRVQ